MQKNKYKYYVHWNLKTFLMKFVKGIIKNILKILVKMVGFTVFQVFLKNNLNVYCVQLP